MTEKKRHHIREIASSVIRGAVMKELQKVYKLTHQIEERISRIEEKISGYDYWRKRVERIGELERKIEQMECPHENKLYREDYNLNSGPYFVFCKDCRKMLFKTSDIKEWIAYMEKEEKK